MPWYNRVLSAINAAALFLAPTQAINLALLTSAILKKQTLCLSELARAYPTPEERRVAAPKHDLLHRVKRLWRFTDNERVDALTTQVAFSGLTSSVDWATLACWAWPSTGPSSTPFCPPAKGCARSCASLSPARDAPCRFCNWPTTGTPSPRVRARTSSSRRRSSLSFGHCPRVFVRWSWPIGASGGPASSPGSNAWAELAAVPANALAVLPGGVSFEVAATLPIAGLTALYALEKGGGLLGRTVLVTGASGRAGHFAVQLARSSGARVVGLVRREEHVELVRDAGAHEVVVSEDASAAREHGPYHLILESVGREVLANALAMLAPGGVCVTFGSSAAAETTFDVRSFFLTGGASLYGFIIFHEVLANPASAGLDRLGRSVADGSLRPRIEVKAPWTEIGDVAERLIQRSYTGKAVLRVS